MSTRGNVKTKVTNCVSLPKRSGQNLCSGFCSRRGMVMVTCFAIGTCNRFPTQSVHPGFDTGSLEGMKCCADGDIFTDTLRQGLA